MLNKIDIKKISLDKGLTVRDIQSYLFQLAEELEYLFSQQHKDEIKDNSDSYNQVLQKITNLNEKIKMPEWTDIKETLTDDFILQQSDSGVLRIRKTGSIVFLEGVLSPVEQLEFSDDKTMFVLPEEYRPSRSVYATFTNGSASNILTWNLKIFSNGNANINLIRNSGIMTYVAAGTWITFNLAYSV